MMSDFIKYRLPGKEIIERSGFFKKSNKYLKSDKSFIVSTYNSNELYIFEESNTKDQFYHFSKFKPTQYSYHEYQEIATYFLENLRKYNINKAVLSRTKNVNFEISKSNELFEYLEWKYPYAFVYLISSKHFGTWLGCSPEILLEANKNKCRTVSLAATKPSESNDEWTIKEKDEQQYVTDFILNQLSDIQVDNINLDGPYPFKAGPVKHLKTDITFEINKKTAIDIAKKINPSPAVSGYPQDLAIELIRKSEKNPRILYTGFIGIDSDKTTNLFVNLRCCQLFEDKAVLYLGGGYTKDSIIIDEWNETEYKSKTLITAIDLLNDKQ